MDVPRAKVLSSKVCSMDQVVGRFYLLRLFVEYRCFPLIDVADAFRYFE